MVCHGIGGWSGKMDFVQGGAGEMAEGGNPVGEDGSELDSARIKSELEQLHKSFYALWRLGSNALVGWHPVPRGIEVVTIPKIRLFSMESPHWRVFHGPRAMDRKTFEEVSLSLGVQPFEIRVATPIGNGPDKLPVASIGQTFAPFAVTRTDYRAVLLIDIVGFSKQKPEIQAAQLATLEFALNIASETISTHSKTFDARRSTTGDGFYVWNATEGLEADIDMFVFFALFEIFHSALGRSVTTPNAVPVIRAVLGIGSHYSYRQPTQFDAGRNEYIVGDVTIQVARLVAKCRAGQILVAAFNRFDQQTRQWIDDSGVIVKAVEALQKFHDFPVMGKPIQKITMYVTGEKKADGGFSRQKMRVVDKHGFEHFCFNLKLNIFANGTDPYYCGFPQQEIKRVASAEPGAHT